jgi:hypothetical protein
VRIDEPKTTALLFSSGKLVITGACSKQMAISAIRSTMYMLSSIFPHIDIFYTNHTIQNIVCNVQVLHSCASCSTHSTAARPLTEPMHTQIRNLLTIDIKRLHKDFGTRYVFPMCWVLRQQQTLLRQPGAIATMCKLVFPAVFCALLS